jgi:hypothetical protein
MIYFDSDMSKSINTVVYFDWKTIIYICDCGQCRTQFMLPNSSRRQFINMYIYDGKVSHMHRSFLNKPKEGRYVRISITLVSQVTLRSSGTDYCMVVTCLDVCIIYFISCYCMMNSSSSYTIY